MMLPRQSGEIPVDRAVLKYEIFGSGIPVIVLHGGPGIGYRYLLPELSESFGDGVQLILYDQRASGQSTGAATPELLTFSTFLDDLVQVYAALGIPRAILMGHSFGGLLAMQFGLRHPDLVAGLVLVDSDPASQALWARYRERLRPHGQEESATLAEIRSQEGWQYDASQVARYFELTLKPFFATVSTIPPDFGQRFALTPPENLFGTSAAVRASLGNWDLHPALRHLKAPVQIIVGDQSIFPEEAVTKLCESLPDAAVTTLKDVAHFPPIESPQAFQEAVSCFIASIFQHNRTDNGSH